MQNTGAWIQTPLGTEVSSVQLKFLDQIFYSLELNDVGMVELSQVLDVSLELLLHFLHGEDLRLVGPHEDGPLGSGAEPFQVLDLLEGNLPGII